LCASCGWSHKTRQVTNSRGKGAEYLKKKRNIREFRIDEKLITLEFKEESQSGRMRNKKEGNKYTNREDK
jgi:hypothetical protein